MRSISPVFFIIVFVFLAVVDLYTFRGLKVLTTEMQSWVRMSIFILHWLIPFILVSFIVFLTQNFKEVAGSRLFSIWTAVFGFFVLFYIPKLVFIAFQLANDIWRLTGFVISKFTQSGSPLDQTSLGMSRAEFLTRIGIVVAAVPFISIAYGIAKGRFNYQVKNIKINFDNLPDAFNGFKIVQISDWHIGSFYGHADRVLDSVELINQQKADIIFFTGDLVNNIASEVAEFVPILQKLSAPYGVYSILGNHDYGEYVHWDTEELHSRNMNELFQHHANAGFKLLRNESFTIDRNNQKIGIAGVENWGLPPFPQYGDLEKALSGLKDIPFKILLSHDPSHWDAQVVKNSDVDLTLSGHTHGMQFGINIPGIKWSPVKWKYPRWSGLYQEGKQILYVNVGIGYIGFPGRVGFLPEITVFELANKKV